ncbi:hypothetical protein Achl_3951 (plasmid) [Pseudarthrobacter chlorophenolicus A6]|uniref:Uncharacterized protein n=1 Tax=Pseudarthrobacter chlorophenolicus (strain ATCC 700700 / DSM 12829 / CIP 107037 / JCM 12360 / KCTC 9906 / NCIMB 13794 / A6) TaxID=452863 RepID=B8HHK5_PSECP|nr:hypothetical protein [Pseudarthrobacter chlorophenolicus]ACL41902.1 hypothetical protein Achl_3951 [Pseudarthrobacter chlorophenolicus A6]SDQ18398.1 hypothetical protein SAMN04489738_0563 [Pseudarthrobacter chlorophenolicus]
MTFAVLIAFYLGVPVIIALLSIRPILLHHSIQLTDEQVGSLPPFLSTLLEKRLTAFVRREGCTLTGDSRIQRRLDLFAALKSRTPEQLRRIKHLTRLGLSADIPKDLKDLHDIRA